jgi:hypothetical protein
MPQSEAALVLIRFLERKPVMASKRKDTASSGICITSARLGFEVKSGVGADGQPYKSVKFYLVVPGCPMPLPLGAKSMRVESGEQVAWLDVCGKSLKELAPSLPVEAKV